MVSRETYIPSSILCTFVVFLMTAITSDGGSASAFALIPAQIAGVKHPVHAKKNRVRCSEQLQNVQDVSTNQFDVLSDDDSAGDEVVYSPPTIASIDSSPSVTILPADSGSVKSKNHRPGRGKNKSVLSRHGNIPDVHWRAIPMSHLRSHPNFKPLPPASHISHLPTKEHVRYFRQESWQWDYLHQGRCTTSQAAAALGFLEPQAALFLGIPKSLQRGGGGAWQRLRQDTSSIDSLEEMERILCENRKNGIDAIDWRPGAKESEKIWIEASKLRNQFPFTAKYVPAVTEEELVSKKIYTEQRIKQSASSLSTRMHWGNAQEATSILTALNYFCGLDKETTIHEVGMCGAGFDDILDSDLNGLKIGASPDALICYGNGTVEVLEVKNHCPFAWNRSPVSHGGSNRRSGKNKKKGHKHKRSGNTKDASDVKLFGIKDFDLECKVPPVYIPQLMMEMFCVGDSIHLDQQSQQPSEPVCTSAIMVRQTATKGAIVLRLRRDEHWLSEMKYFLGEFKKRYVNAGVIPPDDFFYHDEDVAERYQQFLQKTKDLSEGVEQVACIDHGRIQRMVMDKSASYDTPPLFLDDVVG